MNCVPIDDVRDEWDEFAMRSGDAPFHHMTLCMDFMEAYSQNRLAGNGSLAIVDNRQILTNCPLFIEQSGLEEGANQFSCGGAPIPMPAMTNALSPAQRQRVLAFYVQTLESIARQEDVHYVSLRMSPLVRSYLTYGAPFANPSLRHGYMDLA